MLIHKRQNISPCEVSALVKARKNDVTFLAFVCSSFRKAHVWNLLLYTGLVDTTLGNESVNAVCSRLSFIRFVLGHYISMGIDLSVDPSGRAVLRRGSSAACLLRLWVRIPPGAWMSVSCECCVLSVKGLCEGLITCLEESYRTWCV
jgi:hypothetical protein